jgi:DNA-binding LytR/AlgR family response regulator
VDQLKVKLLVRSERYDEIAKTLAERGIEIDDNADLVVSENNRFPDNLIVRDVTQNRRVILSVEDIVYIETYGHIVEVHTCNETFQATDRLYKIVNQLDPEKFLRISNSVVISKNKVKQISTTLSMKFVLTMVNGKKVDVTRSYYYIFKDSFGI